MKHLIVLFVLLVAGCASTMPPTPIVAPNYVQRTCFDDECKPFPYNVALGVDSGSGI